MNNIEYIDSSGLGTLVAAHLSAKTQGASLHLCHLGRKLQEALQMTKLATVLQVCKIWKQPLSPVSQTERYSRSLKLTVGATKYSQYDQCVVSIGKGSAYEPWKVAQQFKC